MTTTKDERDKPDWKNATREGATREQLRRWSLLTLEEIIAAQEEMAELSQHINGAPAHKGKPK